MRWTTIFLFILFLGFNLKAQHKLDSLWKAWSDESLSNEKRIEALTEKVWRDYLFSNPDSGYFYGDLMYRFSKLKNEKQGMLNALNIQAISLTIRGMNQKALEKILTNVPIGRLIATEEVASLVCELYRNEALAGDVFFIHGGLRLGSKG